MNLSGHARGEECALRIATSDEFVTSALSSCHKNLQQLQHPLHTWYCLMVYACSARHMLLALDSTHSCTLLLQWQHRWLTMTP
jgi:hypothetical protein